MVNALCAVLTSVGSPSPGASPSISRTWPLAGSKTPPVPGSACRTQTTRSPRARAASTSRSTCADDIRVGGVRPDRALPEGLLDVDDDECCSAHGSDPAPGGRRGGRHHHARMRNDPVTARPSRAGGRWRRAAAASRAAASSRVGAVPPRWAGCHQVSSGPAGCVRVLPLGPVDQRAEPLCQLGGQRVRRSGTPVGSIGSPIRMVIGVCRRVRVRGRPFVQSRCVPQSATGSTGTLAELGHPDRAALELLDR